MRGPGQPAKPVTARYGSMGDGDLGTRELGQPIKRWIGELVDTELFAAGDKWLRSPAYIDPPCEHMHVVTSKGVDKHTPAVSGGQIMLYCFDCDHSWWEDLTNIKGSPFAK